MDPKPLQNPEIERLIRLSAESRAHLAVATAALREKLDVPARLRSSLKRHPSTWLFGSLASGFVVSLLFGSKRSERSSSEASPAPKRPKSLPAAAVGLALTAARPLAKHWLSKQAEKWLAQAISQSRHQP
jgi:hypothetical protein